MELRCTCQTGSPVGFYSNLSSIVNVENSSYLSLPFTMLEKPHDEKCL